MSLQSLYSAFFRRSCLYAERIGWLQTQRGLIPDWQHRYLTESLISEIWQAWCSFSRTLLHKSLRGTKARDNQVITQRLGDNTWQRIGYEASRAKDGATAKPNGHVGFIMRREPTWGDIDCFLTIVQTIRPANLGQLQSAYGLPLVGPKHLQTVRNCSAHMTIENLLEMRRSFSPIYSLPMGATPIDVAWATKIGTNDFAIDIWINDMRIIAKFATECA